MSNIEAIEFALAVKRGLIPALKSGSKKSELELLDKLSADERESLRKAAAEILSDHEVSFDVAISSLDIDRNNTKKHHGSKNDDTDSHSNNEVTKDFDSSHSLIDGERYKILCECGQGGLGVVFTARDQQLNRIVALKKLHPHLASSSGAVDRFEAEAEITGELQHPAIAPIYSLGMATDGTPFYTMRFIEGKSLADRLKKDGENRSDFGTPEFRQLISTFNQVTRAVDFSHSKQIIHRDIKPANIMLGDYGETFLVDWGLAKSIEQRDHSTDANFENDSTISLLPSEKQPLKSNRTRAGDIVGTPAFMSPEQARGETELTSATDIYGLGATLFSILTGRTPFAKTDSTATLAKLRAGEIPVALDVNTEIPVELNAICRKAMHPRPNERYATANELRNDLERWLSDEPISILVESIGSRIRRGVRKRFAFVASIVVGSVACLILVAAGLIVTSSQNHELNKLNQQLTVSEESAQTSRELANLNFRHAQEIVGEFLVEVAEAPALKNGRADSEEFRKDLLEKARKYYETFIAENASDNRTRLELINAQEKLATIYKEFGDFAQCEDTCNNGLKRILLLDDSDLTPVEKADLAASFYHMRGVSQDYLGRIDESIESLKLAVQTRQEIVDLGLGDPLFIRNLTRNQGSLALALIENGQRKEADQLVDESNQTVAKLADPNHSRVADQHDFLNNKLRAAQVKSELGNTTEAIKLLHEGIERSERLVSLNPDIDDFLRLHACLTQDLASNLIEVDKHQEAEKWVTIAIEFRNRLIASGKSEFDNDLYLTAAYRSLAGIRADLGDLDKAEELSAKAVKLLQGLLRKDDQNQVVRDRLANAYKTQGDVFAAKKDFESASRAFQNGTDAMRELLRSENGDRPRNRHYLAQILNNHANLLSSLNETKQAAEKYRRAAEIIEELRVSTDDPSIAVLRDCVIILAGHGRMLGKTLVGPEGEMVLRKRVDIAKQLYEKTHLESDGHRWAWSINDLASEMTNHSSEKSNLENACNFFKESVTAWESLSPEYKKTDQFAHGLGGTLVNGSDAFKLINDFDTALKWLDDADQLMGPIARRANPHPVVKRFHGIGLRTRAKLQIQIAFDLSKKSKEDSELKSALQLLDSANKFYGNQNVSVMELQADIYMKLADPISAAEILNSALEYTIDAKHREIEDRIKMILERQ